MTINTTKSVEAGLMRFSEGTCIRCDGPGCAAFSWCGSDWMLSHENDYYHLRLKGGNESLHFCSTRCLTQWTVAALSNDLLEMVGRVNDLAIAKIELEHEMKRRTQMATDADGEIE